MNIFSGNSNPILADKIIKELHEQSGGIVIKKFSNGECYVEYPSSVRNETAVIIQSTARSFGNAEATANSVNDNLMFQLLMADALKLNGASQVMLCSPYFAYARQDHTDEDARAPLSAALVINMLKVAGVTHLITTDIHNRSIMNAFRRPFKNVKISDLFANDIRQNYEISNMIIVSPDYGGQPRARAVANRLGLDNAFCYKKRGKAATEANKIKQMMLVSEDDVEVKGKDVILTDDIADTCGTLIECTNLLYARGAKSVRAYATHGEFSGNALDAIAGSALKELITTDTIANEAADKLPNTRRISVAQLLAHEIYNMMTTRR
ncbi:MAG: ribose-phosphate pyrophosphokinase [Rickettsiales bacterium]|jgi:ribose-phosphate pyrophosphokinase|nr:ribose-phosphate pyrophosphokinase [Rickettsiales bacterium]